LAGTQGLCTRMWLRWLIVAALFGALWLLISRPSEQEATRGEAPQAGFAAPAFTLTGLDGAAHSLSDYQGQGVIVNFWATWCGPCRAEMPALQQIADDYAGRGVVVLLVNVGEDQNAVWNFLSQLQITAPVLLDPDGAASRQYRVRAMPTTYFIQPDGTIQHVSIGGPLAEAYLRSRAEELLAASP
jgi:cytochrome c biogenesis protein CcmG, thiol:disulfide interchange protein DsbE